MKSKVKLRNSMITLYILIFLTIPLVVFTVIYIRELFAVFIGVGAAIMTFIVIKVRDKVMINKYEYFYDQLFYTQEKPISLNEKILNDEWLKKVTDKYQLTSFINTSECEILYAIIPGIRPTKREKTLLTIVVIKNQKTIFESKNIAIELNEFEKVVLKKHKFKNRVFIQFKVGEFSQNELMSANKVYFIERWKVHFVIVNVIVNTKINQAYFLHSNKFSPSRYYQFAIDKTKEIINV